MKSVSDEEKKMLARLCTCALILLHYYYLPLLVLLLVRFDLVGVIVFAFTPILAFEALLLAARMVLLTFVVVLEFFAAEVALTLMTAFFFVEWEESRECIQVATGHGFLLFFSRHLD